MRTALLLLLLVGLFLPRLSAGQVPTTSPAPPTPPESSSAPAASTHDSSSSGKPHQTIPAFLILGTVFNEKDYAFPGVEVKIRRKGEKKFLYDMYTNSRGEFGVRVPDGIEYEVVVRQRNYKEQSQDVVANMAEVQKRLTFKLESSVPPKPGAKAGESK
jgi:hypothetical protein